MIEIVAYIPSEGNVSVGDTVKIGATVKVDSDRLWVGHQSLTVCDTYEPIMVGYIYDLTNHLQMCIKYF